MAAELNMISNRLMKLIKNTNELRGKQPNSRDEATLRDMDGLIEKMKKPKVSCEVIATSVVLAAAEVVDAALEAKAELFIELKSDESFLTERLKRLNKAAA